MIEQLNLKMNYMDGTSEDAVIVEAVMKIEGESFVIHAYEFDEDTEYLKEDLLKISDWFKQLAESLA